MVMNIFADATAVARALGLDIDLPDSDNEDPAYWEQVHADGGYKRRIEGRIADPWFKGDPDCALLPRLPWGEVWFDIEEGVKLFLPAAEIARALLLLDGLRAKGTGPTGDDGRSLVCASPTRFADGVLPHVRKRREAPRLAPAHIESIRAVPPDRPLTHLPNSRTDTRPPRFTSSSAAPPPGTPRRRSHRCTAPARSARPRPPATPGPPDSAC